MRTCSAIGRLRDDVASEVKKRTTICHWRHIDEGVERIPDLHHIAPSYIRPKDRTRCARGGTPLHILQEPELQAGTALEAAGYNSSECALQQAHPVSQAARAPRDMYKFSIRTCKSAHSARNVGALPHMRPMSSSVPKDALHSRRPYTTASAT